MQPARDEVTEDARALVLEYLDRVWGQKDLDALDALLDPGYRRHISPILEPLSIAGQRARLGAMQAAFPDASIELGEFVAEGDLVAFQSIMRGSHLGKFRGLPPTGRTFEVHLVDLVRVGGGRLLEHWGGPDMLDLLTQLGVTVEPGPIERGASQPG
jgi:predicted ester cyclase